MEEQVQQGQVAVSTDESAGLSPLMVQAIIYAVVAFFMACFVVFVNNAPAVKNAGVLAKILAIIVATGVGALGALLGNALRLAVHPDAVFTMGGFWSLLWIKVFWKWGPQTIGMVAGVFIAAAMVLK